MLKIVLEYDMEAELQEMQTVTAQDIDTFTEARDCLVYQNESFYLREQLEAVIKLLRNIRATMEAPEDASNECVTNLEDRLQAITINASDDGRGIIVEHGHMTGRTDWDKKFRARKFHDLFIKGGRIDDDMFQYSPYTNQMKAQYWDDDLAFFEKKLQYMIDEPLPIEPLYLFGSLPRPDLETVGIIFSLFSYDFDEVRHRDRDLEKFLILREKLRNKEDFLERASLDTIIKILQLSQTTNPDTRAASLRNLYRNSWIINISRLGYFLTERVLEHDEDDEPPEIADAYLLLMIKTAQSFDIEEMDQASLPIRLKIMQNLRIGIFDCQIDHLMDPVASLMDKVNKAMPRAVANTSTSTSPGYHKQGSTRDLCFLIGTLRERIRAYFNSDNCVRNVDGSNTLADGAFLDDEISRMTRMLLSYNVEEIELDSLAPSLAAIVSAKAQLQKRLNYPKVDIMKDLTDLVEFLEKTLETKRLEVPAPRHEEGAWAADHSKLLVLLGHRHRIWRDAALRELTDMAAFNRSLDAQMALVRGYSCVEMDSTSSMLRLEDTKECFNMLDGVLIWYQFEEITSLIETMQGSEGYESEDEFSV